VFSAIWGICFSLKVNPNGMRNIAFWHGFGTGGSPAAAKLKSEHELTFIGIAEDLDDSRG